MVVLQGELLNGIVRKIPCHPIGGLFLLLW